MSANQTFGGNESSIEFNPGVYYISVDLKFNEASITSPNGVTFVLTNHFWWTNSSNISTRITAPTTGATAAAAIWQPFAASQSSSFQGGSTLLISGTVSVVVSVAHPAIVLPEVQVPLHSLATPVNRAAVSVMQ